MSTVERVQNVVVSMKDLLKPEDREFIQSLLRHSKADLALEVLCDQLLDNRSYISEEKGLELQELANERNLAPEYSWEFLVIYDQRTGEPKRLLRKQDGSIEASIRMIIDETKNHIDERTLSLINEFLEVGEIVLCVETLFDYIVEGQIKLSKSSYNEMVSLAIACHFIEDDIKKSEIL